MPFLGQSGTSRISFFKCSMILLRCLSLVGNLERPEGFHRRFALLNGRNAGSHRTAPKLAAQLVQGFWRSHCQHLDVAFVEIAHVSRQSQGCGAALHEPAESHALHASLHYVSPSGLPGHALKAFHRRSEKSNPQITQITQIQIWFVLNLCNLCNLWIEFLDEFHPLSRRRLSSPSPGLSPGGLRLPHRLPWNLSR